MKRWIFVLVALFLIVIIVIIGVFLVPHRANLSDDTKQADVRQTDATVASDITNTVTDLDSPSKFNLNTLTGAMQGNSCSGLGYEKDIDMCNDYIYISKNRDNLDCNNVKSDGFYLACVLIKNPDECKNLPKDRFAAIDCNSIVPYVLGKTEITEADVRTKNTYNLLKAYVSSDESVCDDIVSTGNESVDKYQSKELCKVLARG